MTEPLYDGLPFSYIRPGASPKDTKPPAAVAAVPATDVTTPQDSTGFSYLTGTTPETQVYENAYNTVPEKSYGHYEADPPARQDSPMYEGQREVRATHDNRYEQQQQQQQQQQRRQHGLPRTRLSDVADHNATVSVEPDFGRKEIYPQDRWKDSPDPGQLYSDRGHSGGHSGRHSGGRKAGGIRGYMVILIVTVVLCLGIGFILGWFLRQMTDTDDSKYNYIAHPAITDHTLQARKV